MEPSAHSDTHWPLSASKRRHLSRVSAEEKPTCRSVAFWCHVDLVHLEVSGLPRSWDSSFPQATRLNHRQHCLYSPGPRGCGARPCGNTDIPQYIFTAMHHTVLCRLTIASSTTARVLNSAAVDAGPLTCCRGPQSAPGHLRSGYAPIYVWPIDAAIPNVL